MAVDSKIKVVENPTGKGLPQFLKEVKAEMKRVTWPNKKDVKKAIAAVGTFCVIYVVIVGVLDYGFNNLYKLIFK